jgi:class 3 adenylate cyclase
LAANLNPSACDDRELDVAREREAATREILEVISRSRDDEKPVFDAILRNAARFCRAENAGLVLVSDDQAHFRVVATLLPQAGFVPGENLYPLDLDLGAANCMREAKIVHRRDLRELLGNESKSGLSEEATRQLVDEGVRSTLWVPLLAGSIVIGSFGLYRHEVQEFADDEISLVEAFAVQAVIAIENVRQFKALESRTKEVQALNAGLEAQVKEQVSEIERMGKLKRFLPSAVANTVVSSGSEEMLKSHRALLGVLFCDIRGFTAFCETAEPEETIEVLQTYHEEMGRLIDAHGAGVDLRMGDGIMVLFNDPIPCDDPAGDAVRLAIAMREQMAELCKRWKRLGHRLGFGIGVSLGYATVGMVGFEGRLDYTASGTAVNLAARLCDEALDGEILLSPRAHISIEDDFPTELKGASVFKGIREPVEVFRLTDTTDG